jgi:hypothetical protein
LSSESNPKSHAGNHSMFVPLFSIGSFQQSKLH